jgi:hypothetical protein
MSPRTFLICAAVLALLPTAASAQALTTFRCTAKDGKKYYGNTVPPQCFGRLVEQLNTQGMVIKRIEPEASEKEMEAKEAEREQKAKLDAAAREQTRRDRALLATYTSEKDIEQQRARALADNEKTVREIGQRIVDLQKKRAGFDKEMEFYEDKSGKTKAPPRLLEEMRQTEFDLKVQQDALENKKKEVSTINAKYDDDKKRYRSLTKR